jgi:hypothetical protein
MLTRKSLTLTGVSCEGCPALFVVPSWFWQSTPFAPQIFVCPAEAVPEVLGEFGVWLAMPISEVVEESAQRVELGSSVEE